MPLCSLASKPWGSSCAHLHDVDTTDVNSHSQLFLWVLGSRTQSSLPIYIASALQTKASPAPSVPILQFSFITFLKLHNKFLGR